MLVNAFRDALPVISSCSMSPTPANDRAPQTKTLSSSLLELVFTWQHDRWTHSIHPRAVDGRPSTASWQAAPPNSADDPNWPMSPPLVELAEVAGPEGTALVGVGRAGKTHYSVSITPEPNGTVRFEFACRLVTSCGWLGSTYIPLETASRVAFEPIAGVVFRPPADSAAGPHRLQIRPSAADDTPRGSGKKGVTVQWSYRVGVAEAP